MEKNVNLGDAELHVAPAKYPEGAWLVRETPWGEPLEFASRREARKYAKAHSAEIRSSWSY